MKYPLVLFDFDGTLADTRPLVMGWMDQLAAEFHLERPADLSSKQLPELDARQFLRKYHVPLWKMAWMTRRVRRLMAANDHPAALFDGALEMLNGLAGSGATLGVVSSNSEQNVRAAFGAEVAGLFRYYECGVSLFGKPLHVRRILRRSGLPAAGTILIGDEVRDVEAARASGVSSGAVTWGYGRAESLSAAGPDYLFATFSDILNLSD